MAVHIHSKVPSRSIEFSRLRIFLCYNLIQIVHFSQRSFNFQGLVEGGKGHTAGISIKGWAVTSPCFKDATILEGYYCLIEDKGCNLYMGA